MSVDPIAKEIFLSAIEIERQDQRDSFVTGACRGDEGLYKEVCALLEAHFEKDSWLDPRVIRNAIQPTASLDPLESLKGIMVGSHIGNYKLLEQIGAGGMGIVFMAEQMKPIRRKVALKIIKPGMDTGQVVARFEAERQALALMDHPNIAHVLDAGATDTGRPYFVMELVRGIPITEYCDKNRLNTRDRLKLFSSVCQAVQHAHNKGIIHRDIKPSNVLVTLHDGIPVPKIIDFGVAKAINQQLTDRTLFTSFAQFVGTPLYMSPEQAEMSGLDVDTRSDVYSLGVLLYELLTGTTPFDRTRLHQAALDEVRRIIRDEEPPRPSTRVSSLGCESATFSMHRSTDPVKLKQLLLRELDWIVMKTLEKDRTRRYETVNQLASEIDRYLDGQPVQACPPSKIYLLRKFAYRYRTTVAIAACFLLLVLGASTLSFVLAAMARQARDIALAAQTESQRQRDHALDAERNSARHLEIASQEKERADQHALELKQKLYDYSLIKANAAYRDRDFKMVFSSLSDCLPEQRGWEWHFLNRQSNGVRAIPIEGNNNVEFEITPDLTRVILVDTEGNVRCSRLSDGRVEWSSSCQITVPTGSAITADSRLFVLTGSRRVQRDADKPSAEEGAVEAFDIASGQRLWSQAVVGYITTFLPCLCRGDSQLLVTAMGSAGSTVQLRSAKLGEIIWSTPSLTIAQALMNKAGTRIFISESHQQQVSPPGRVRCINADDRTEVWKLERPDEASGIRLSLDEQELLATGKNLSLTVYDANTGEARQSLPNSSGESGLLVCGGRVGNYVLTVSRTGQFVVWDWKTKRPLETSKSMSFAFGLKVSADESQLAFLRPDEKTLLVRPLRPTSEPLTLVGHKTGFKAARFLDAERLVSVGNEGAIRIWNAVSGQEIVSSPLEAEGLELDVAADAGWIATATTKGTKVWDASSRKLLQHWPRDGQVWFVKSDSRRTLLATAGEQGILRIYRTEGATNGNRLWPAQVSSPSFEQKTSSPIHGLATSADGSKVFTLNSPGCEVICWDVASGSKQVLRRAQPGQSGRSLEISPHGKFLAVGVERNVELWDLENNTQNMVLRDAESNVLSLAFNHSGTRLLSGTSAGSILLWNLASGERLLNYLAHNSYVVSLAFSPDDQRLASSSHGGELKIWDIQKISPEVAVERDLVQNATRIANRLIVQHRTPKAALGHLLSDDSVHEGLLPTVTAILQARMPAPINLNALSVAVDKTINDTKNSSEARPAKTTLISSPLLKEKIDGLLAKNLPDILQPTQRLPDSIGTDSWNTLCRTLVLPSTFKLTPEELIERLQQIIEGGDTPHYIHYLKAIAHLQLAQYEPAADEMSQAIRLVPEKSPLWFTYSFRLSFLLAHVQRWEEYKKLCSTALHEFKDDSDSITLERLAKMCLFSKNSPDLDAALTIADKALTQADSIAPKVFLRLTKGIAELRRRNYSAALEHLDFVGERSEGSTEGHRIIRATAKVYSAIALCELNRQDEARSQLAEAEPVLKDFPATSGWWPDWMLVSIIVNEAKELLSSDQKGPQ